MLQFLSFACKTRLVKFFSIQNSSQLLFLPLSNLFFIPSTPCVCLLACLFACLLACLFACVLQGQRKMSELAHQEPRRRGLH
jgi:uncharacterized membrane protein